MFEIGVMQERTGCPLMCTVHAPHSATPQPNFVPVKPSVSRKTQSSGICGATSTVCGLPFRLNLIVAIRSPWVPGMSVYTVDAALSFDVPGDSKVQRTRECVCHWNIYYH